MFSFAGDATGMTQASGGVLHEGAETSLVRTARESPGGSEDEGGSGW
jgi:hypothetical protein